MAGAPIIRDKFKKEVHITEQEISKHLSKYVRNMMALADGVCIQEDVMTGVKVYTKPPDRQANEYLINRILGKPKEQIDGDVVIHTLSLE